MQKPTFLKPSTFVSGVAALLLAGTSFFSPALAGKSSPKSDPQPASSPAQQTPASSATQDSSATPTPAKPAAEVTPEAKHAPAATSKAKPSATAPAAKPAAATGSQASDAAKASSSSSAPAPSAKQATTATGQSATKTGSTATTKTGQAASKTTKAGASKTPTAKTATPLMLKTDKDKQSYAIGINVGKGLGQNLKQSGLEIDPAVLTRAIKDVLAGDKQSMTDQEAQETLKNLQADLRKAQEEKTKQLADTNKKEGDEFLAANKTKEGITTLPDGLQYKILQEGTGPKPAPSDAVTVNYRGTLVNGTEFDSSYKHNQPATFNVTGIIKGWTEALELMPVGSKWQLFIPSDLAYGPSGRPPVIGPNSTLVFEVELISIQPKPAAPTPTAAPAANPAPAAATPNAPTGNPAPVPNAPTPPKPAPPAPPTPKSDPAPAPNPTPTPKPPTP